MRTILLVILILLLIGALPVFPYSTGWGYYPSGGLILLIVLVLLLVRALRADTHYICGGALTRTTGSGKRSRNSSPR